MQIKKLKIKKLYGYLDKDIDFNSDMTLLVGINGSGKTSILNLLNWIIRPSLPNLCVTEFKSIQLNLSFNNVEYKITCKHNKTTFHYKIQSDKEIFNPLIVKLLNKPSEINNDEHLRESLIQMYTGLKPDTKEEKTWELISKFPNPTIIGLDRNLYTEEPSEQIYFEESYKVKRIKKVPGTISNPLERVKEIINREYRKRKNLVLNLTNNLKNQLMLSTFDGSITLESLTSGVRYKLNHQQIENAEKRVNDYLKNYEKQIALDKELEKISEYFSQLKKLIKQYQSNPNNERVKLLYGLNANQFIKVRKLLKEFEKFETRSNEIMLEINNYIDTLNFFFKDSAKKLTFKEDTSEITFNTLDKDLNVIKKFRDIKYLSSGEQQLLILISYIAFNSQDGKLFIIDEPELSLHIKWQEDFLEKLDLITPRTTQLILATHSPILANKKKDKARILLPYNT